MTAEDSSDKVKKIISYVEMFNYKIQLVLGLIKLVWGCTEGKGVHKYLSKQEITILKICLMAIVCQLHYRLSNFVERTEVVLPTETFLINQINSVYKFEHLKPMYSKVRNEF